MYFSKFPLLRYKYIDKDTTLRTKLATNILKRVGFTDLSKGDKDHFITYDVIEGEKPEVIADKLYGDPEYHWIVLLFNDIINPYKDWPMGSYEIDQYVEKKYTGDSLFLSDANGNHPSTIDFHANQTVADSSGGKDSYGVYSMNEKRARVISWDPQYSRLVVDKTEENSERFQEGDYVIGIGSTGQAVVGQVQRVVFHSEAVHHFEKQKGNDTGAVGGTAEYIWLNSLATSELTGQIPMGATGATFGSGNTGTGVYIDSSPQFGETLVGAYMGICGDNNDDNVTTNRQYEYRLNNNKKKIKLLHPDYISLAENELEGLLKVRGLIA